MFFKFLLIFILVPLIELYFLLEISQFIGVFTTVMVIVFTGAAGVSIAKRQGYQVVNNIRSTLNSGKMPTDDLISALLILIGGVTLLTPGFLTDITGFLLILPGSRDLIGSVVKKYFLKYVKENKVEVHYGNQFNQRRDNSQYKNNNSDQSYKDDFIDVEAEKVEED
ncbi:FxsA cytoplasmic membrane protein [Halanaerobium saccharolyticum subsp. saccharolyticum DSM 6643]|uniref:FxsA cytoplasmic membrane protein n=1 Tax=Halanaerobium saccharolyticum subsp. saccharolyticum DSM 6643 TaxID=1293054 RepID=M5DZA5_9FIRM|nr:FxsA family protein [Halanaerobium saccharolyticum]CCU78428.1 FxsA cytoplasmic membrane protein [Halanaerobium saccharolyticum subsp. saccharolyticum DSM 6643]